MPLFESSSERAVTKAIVAEFIRDMDEIMDTDVIVIGGGPSGLMAAYDLARKGSRVVIIEKNNYLGGGFWMGGFLMNSVTVRAPAEKILAELGIKCREFEPGLYTTPGPLACSKLIAAACEAGAKVLNMVSFDDVVLRDGNRVAGAVVNWSPISYLPKPVACVDPISIEAKVVIDGTGHDASVARKLEERGLLEVSGCGAMWIEKSEDAVVEKTGFLHPGLIVVGMSVSATYGLPRMGPTFGSMLLSGRKGAQLASESLEETG
ncbi:MAG: thiazole biosynthesis protein [Methanobacteriota archaeon]|nr:MAG: thiazole biosynthesis protein [Euryarchaeota archaeon]